MNTLNEKIILTDCDGVLVDWLYSFGRWMKEEHGISGVSPDEYDLGKAMGMSAPEAKKYVETFNLSSAIGYMKPERDAIKYVRKLHEDHGYVFHCITSMNTNESAYKARKYNLDQLFGPTAFESLVSLPCGADKDDALLKYKDSGCWWIEDKPENVITGSNMGLNCIMIEHPFNRDREDAKSVSKTAKNWKEIYKYITEGYI